jgi:O-antigen/teichoic acid export membrane protein
MPPAAMPRLLRDSTLYFVGNMAGRLLSLVMIPFYTHHLSTEEYGILALVELSTSIVAIVFGLQSIGQTLTRVYHDQDDVAERRRVVSTTLLGTALLAVCIAALAAIFAGPIAAAINLPGEIALLRAGFAAMVFSTLAEVVLVYQRMRERSRFFLIYSMVSLAATLVLNIWFIGALHFGVWGFVSSKLAVAGVGSVFLLAYAFSEVGLAWRARHARALARFGAPLVLSSTAYFSIHFSDRLFLAHVSKSDVGIYQLAYNFAFLLSILVGDSFGKSWDVTFYSYAADEGWQTRFARIGAWLFFVLGAGAVGISVFGQDVLRLVVPPAYLPPLLMLPVLVFGYFFREIGDFFRNILLIDLGSGLVGRIALAGAVLNLALNIVLIPRYGIWGAAIATFLTWVAYCALCWVAALRAHDVPFQLAPLGRLLVMAFTAVALQHAIHPSGRFPRLLLDLVWLALFLLASATIYLGKAQRREALEMLRRFLQKTTGRAAPAAEG